MVIYCNAFVPQTKRDWMIFDKLCIANNELTSLMNL